MFVWVRAIIGPRMPTIPPPTLFFPGDLVIRATSE